MALRTGSALNKAEWKDHFTNIGIPDEFAEVYAGKFVDQQIHLNVLKLVSDNELQNTFQVKLLGHRLLIQSSAAEHVTIAPVVRSQVRYHPPQLKPVMNPSAFRSFVHHWNVYKEMVGIPNTASQLFTLACSDNPEIRLTIADHKSDHLSLSETDYLELLRKLLTSQASHETYRHKFFNMTQNHGETCHQWLKRLKEIVPDCEFTMPCSNKDGSFHKYDESLLRTKFILGLYNTHIKQDLLTKSPDLSSLDAVFNHATRMEATSRDMNLSAKTIAEITLDDNISSTSEEEEINKISTYRKLQKSRPSNSQRQSSKYHQVRPCDGCGSTQHMSSDRSSKCPAWKKACKQCGKRGHFSKVCRAEKATDSANAVIAAIPNNEKDNGEIELTITPTGNRRSRSHKEALIRVLPDTGASLCVAGLPILKKLGVKLSQLKTTSKNIVNASQNKIHCRGWLRARLAIDNHSTIQDIYICDKVQRVYLSKTGCKALGIIHEDFPKPLKKSTPTTPCPTSPTKPANIPFAPTDENIPLLKKYLLETFAETAFNDDKTRAFPKMLGVPTAHIHLKPDAKPHCRATPNQIPYFWRDATKELIDQFTNRGLIERSPLGRPSPWCFPMVITPKKSNTLYPKLRMTIDFQNLNSQCVRELHHVESPFKLASQIPRNTYKTLLDAVDGYQAIELDKESQHLTTFITHWGLYHWLRLPAGLIDSGDKYTSRYDLVIQHIPRKVKCVDDTLLFDSTITEAFFHTFDYLHTCATHGIVLNPSKFQFCQKEVTFAGFRVTPNGMRPSDATIRAIKEFPTPKSTTDVRSWFGLVRQVAYAHSISEDLAPLRGLLKHTDGEKTKFLWNDQLQRAFERSKDHVTNSVVEGIETFDQGRWTCLQCDWSKDGVGFLLLQKHCKCPDPDPLESTLQPCCESGWKTCYAGSRFTNDAESRYAPTEGEALAVAWALKTSRLFTLGCPKLIIVTDHKPLLGILNNRDLGSIKNPRIRRIKEHTLDYKFEIKHCPGKLHVGADALSRYPVRSSNDTTDEISEVCEDQLGSIVDHAINSITGIADTGNEPKFPTALTLEKVQLACLQDTDYQELHTLVTSGFPSQRASVPDHAKTYWPFAQKDLLTTYESIVLYQERLVIPKSLRTYVIQILHSAHQGCTGMISRASTSFYWPGMRKSILSYQTNCRLCSEIAPSQAREPLSLTTLPERPFQIICSDIFQLKGHYYLTVVDRFSGFLHIFYSKDPPTHKFLQTHLRDIFVRYGRPDQIDTDGGPQYQSHDFQEFLRTWGVKHRLSSPYYPQSNGRAELAVKTARRLLSTNVANDGTINNDKVACAVLQYHNTPLQGSPMSPAQLLFGRTLVDFLPTNPKAYQLHPHWAEQVAITQQNRSLHHQGITQRYNFGTRTLSPLTVGQRVVIQNHSTKRWDRSGVIKEVLPHRKYKLQLNDTGNITFRNRRFLKLRDHNFTTSDSGPYSGPISGPTPPRRGTAFGDINNVPPVVEGEDEPQQPPPLLEDRTNNEPQQPSSSRIDPDTRASGTREPLALRRLRPHNHQGLSEHSY